MARINKILLTFILLMGGMVFNVEAQPSGCKNQCDTPYYCVTNKNIDCYINIEYNVVCNGDNIETGQFTLGPSSCTLSPKQECIDFPSCTNCHVDLQVEGRNFTQAKGPEVDCIEPNSCVDFIVDYHPTKGTCLSYNSSGKDCGPECD